MQAGRSSTPPIGAVTHRRIREAILSGELAPGSTLSQVALADALGVSRTPLREALGRLEGEGLLDVRPRRRLRVTEVSADDVEDLMTLRLVAETAATRLSVPHLMPEDIARMHGSIAAMHHFEDARDWDRWAVPHRDFHRVLVSRPGPRFLRLLDQAFDHTERYRRLQADVAAIARARREHLLILAAARDGDAPAAARRVGQHIEATARSMIQSMDVGHDATRLNETVRALLHNDASPD